MLVRITCARCNLSSIWTDDPRWFLESVCNGGARCEATLVADTFTGAVIADVEPPGTRDGRTRAQKGGEH